MKLPCAGHRLHLPFILIPCPCSLVPSPFCKVKLCTREVVQTRFYWCANSCGGLSTLTQHASSSRGFQSRVSRYRHMIITWPNKAYLGVGGGGRGGVPNSPVVRSTISMRRRPYLFLPVILIPFPWCSFRSCRFLFPAIAFLSFVLSFVFLPPSLLKLISWITCRSLCFQALFHALGMSDSDYKFGLSRIFFRPGKVRLGRSLKSRPCCLPPPFPPHPFSQHPSSPPTVCFSHAPPLPRL